MLDRKPAKQKIRSYRSSHYSSRSRTSERTPCNVMTCISNPDLPSPTTRDTKQLQCENASRALIGAPIATASQARASSGRWASDIWSAGRSSPLRGAAGALPLASWRGPFGGHDPTPALSGVWWVWGAARVRSFVPEGKDGRASVVSFCCVRWVEESWMVIRGGTYSAAFESRI